MKLKQTFNSIIRRGIATGIVLLLLVMQSYAHFPWINAVDHHPEPGKTINLTVGWGHQYPFGGFLKNDDLKNIYIVGADKEKKTVTATNALEFQSDESIDKAGVYIIAAERKPGFYTKTTEGGKRSSKKGLAPNSVIESSHSTMCAKAVVNVGDGKDKVDLVVGHVLEIVPQDNPSDLKEGEYMSVQVLLKGKPFKGMIYATYVGFSTEKDTFAYATSTDSKGMGKIKMLTSGVWLIKAKHEEPYHDLSESDKESYVATLTFEVK